MNDLERLWICILTIYSVSLRLSHYIWHPKTSTQKRKLNARTFFVLLFLSFEAEEDSETRYLHNLPLSVSIVVTLCKSPPNEDAIPTSPEKIDTNLLNCTKSASEWNQCLPPLQSISDVCANNDEWHDQTSTGQRSWKSCLPSPQQSSESLLTIRAAERFL